MGLAAGPARATGRGGHASAQSPAAEGRGEQRHSRPQHAYGACEQVPAGPREGARQGVAVKVDGGPADDPSVAVPPAAPAPAAVSACPRCGAAARRGAPWCTQCFLDLRPEPAAPPAPPDPQAAPPAPAATAEGPTWPCTGCGTANPLAQDTCSGCELAFLADLHQADAPSAVLPLVGDLLRLGRGQRVAAALALVVVLVGLAGLLALLLS